MHIFSKYLSFKTENIIAVVSNTSFVFSCCGVKCSRSISVCQHLYSLVLFSKSNFLICYSCSLIFLPFCLFKGNQFIWRLPKTPYLTLVFFQCIFFHSSANTFSIVKLMIMYSSYVILDSTVYD